MKKSKKTTEPIIFGRPNTGMVRMPVVYDKDLHRHSLTIIKNTFENNPTKYLLYLDERWHCWLFPNWKTKDTQKENLENIKMQLSTELKVDMDTIQGYFWFERVHEKYSESAGKNKWYQHSFYDVKISSFPDWTKQPDFEINGKHFYWMTIEEMETDPRIMKVNADIVNVIKEAEKTS